MDKINAEELINKLSLSDKKLEDVSGGDVFGYPTFEECLAAKKAIYPEIEAKFWCTNGFYPDPSGTK